MSLGLGLAPRRAPRRVTRAAPGEVVMHAEGVALAPTVVVPATQSGAEFSIRADAPEGKIVTIFAAANGVTVTADLAVRPNGLPSAGAPSAASRSVRARARRAGRRGRG